MKKELYVFVLLSFFITLINLGAQIRDAQRRYTAVSFALNQPLRYLTDFSVNASQSEIDQLSDEESNCGPPSQKQKKPSRNAVNVDDCRASKDVFGKDINLLVPDVEKQNQPGEMSSAANDLAIFGEINKEKMSEELGPAISSQLAVVAMKYYSKESKNPVVLYKILDGLENPANCSGVCVPILNEAVAKNRKMMPFHKRAGKRLYIRYLKRINFCYISSP